MIAIVTGAPGWLGSSLVQKLTGRPVRCLVEAGADTSELARGGAEIVNGDLRSPDSLTRLFEGARGATVFHAAGVIHPGHGIKQFYEVNVQGTKNLLAAAAKAGVRRFVHVSSNSPIGTNPAPDHVFDETAPYNPYMHYGRSKMMAEEAVKAAADLETVIIRPPWFYGPNQPARQTTFFTMIKTGKVPLVGNGENRRSMAYVDNICQGLLLCESVAAARGQTYWIADRRPYTMNEIIQTIEDVMEQDFGLKPARKRIRLPSLASEVAWLADKSLQGMGLYQQKLHVLSEMNKTIACTVAKAERELGYKPEIELREGMRRSMQWMKDRGMSFSSTLDLVTGGAGYFGSLVVRRLRADGRKVRILDINRPDDVSPDVEVIKGDIRDPAAVARACAGAATVYHNVAQVPLAKDRELFTSVNEGGTRILLDASLAAAVEKVVYTSSSAVFGAPDHNPVTEETRPRPQEDYGRAKLAGEELCHAAVARGLDVSIIRPRTIMGHGRLGIMQILFEWVRQGRNIPVLGRGDNLYQFVHADDLADACVRAAARPGAELFNIGAERYSTMRDTLEALARHAGTGSRVVSVPVAPAIAMMKLTSRLGLSPLGAYHSLMYSRAMYFDVSKAKKLLGYNARFSNEEMFRDSYDWYLAHREEVLARQSGSHHTSAVNQGILRLVSRVLG